MKKIPWETISLIAVTLGVILAAFFPTPLKYVGGVLLLIGFGAAFVFFFGSAIASVLREKSEERSP